MIKTTDLVEKIRAESPRVAIRNERLGVDEERIIVEGDIGLSEVDVLPYAARRIEIAEAVLGDPGSSKQGLLGIERAGKILRWRPGKNLTYCVWRPSFSAESEYAAVVDGMHAATADWEAICGVEFDHVAARDTDPNLAFGDVVFPVIRQLGGGNTVAMAFFPDGTTEDRIVWVFDGYFGPTSTFDPTGVMRHELGHALGFRHEHIRPEAPDLFNPESTEHTVEITAYDPMSVMHYVAGNVGDPQLQFTDLDKSGARRVYGGPTSEFSFED